MGSVALPGGFPVGHPCLGKQSSLPAATEGGSCVEPALTLTAESTGALASKGNVFQFFLLYLNSQK